MAKIEARHIEALDTLHHSASPMTIRDIGNDIGWTPAKSRAILNRLVDDLCADKRMGNPTRYEITGRGQAILFKRSKPDHFPKREGVSDGR